LTQNALQFRRLFGIAQGPSAFKETSRNACSDIEGEVAMDWQRLLSTKRLGAENAQQTPRPGRTEFESDIDRIAFSSAFRRLGRKTQVHPLVANDHVHTRLTHSLEVSRVGKALGKALGKSLLDQADKYRPSLPAGVTPDDLGNIVQAACLAHDVGNPAFGHAGEEAIIHWFDENRDELPDFLRDEHRHDLSSLEGNAQGFRIVTQLQNRLFDGGLRLTYATLGAFQKYPWTSRKRQKKFGAYISEEAILDKVFAGLGVRQKGDHEWCRHPLAHLVEAADDICYAIIDLEDAVELGILTFADAVEVLFSLFDERETKEMEASFESLKMHRVNFARMRGKIFDRTVSGAIEAYLAAYDRIMAGEYNGPVLELLPNDDPRRTTIERAKKLASERIYSDPKKIELEIGRYAIFDALLSEMCPAALNQAEVLGDRSGQSKIDWKAERVLRLLGNNAPSKDNAPPGGWTPYQCIRRVIDYVCGMTDNYATYIASQLQGRGFSGGQRP
jgi:dGTPase